MQKQFKITGAIFDADGTLLDSMPMWTHLGERYLLSRGKVPEEGLGKLMQNMTLEEGAKYFQTNYGLEESGEEIIFGMLRLTETFYKEEIQLKAGVKEFLEFLAERKIPICIATATDKELLQGALSRLQILNYFKDIFTCSQYGSKEFPDIFAVAVKALGTPKNSTWVFEDSLYAMRTAKKFGLQVAGLYDSAAAKDAASIKKVVKIYEASFTNMPKYFL
jgi:HAD superfamily hydrolase (TIGR01509 family)